MLTLEQLQLRREHARLHHQHLRMLVDLERRAVWWARLSGLMCVIGAALGLTGWDSAVRGVPFVSGCAVGVNVYVFFIQYVRSERQWMEFLRHLELMPREIAEIEKMIDEAQRNEGETKNENQA